MLLCGEHRDTIGEAKLSKFGDTLEGHNCVTVEIHWDDMLSEFR